MPSISVPGAIAVGAGISAGGSLLSGLLGSSGAQKAASQQAFADKMAALLQQQRYETTRGDLLPYNLSGQSVLGPLSTLYQATQPQLDQAFANAQNAIPTIPNQATILNMPGYQFNLDQGLKAIQSQETAGGKGLSGAATKAAQNYSTGLASNYLQQYFNMGQQQFADQSTQLANAINKQNTIYNMLYGPAAIGENAAAQTGVTGANLANYAGQNLAAAGQAQATGTATAAGAIGSSLNNAANTGGNALLTYALLGNQAGQNAAATGANNSPAVASSAPDYTGGASATQLSYLGLNPSGGI